MAALRRFEREIAGDGGSKGLEQAVLCHLAVCVGDHAGAGSQAAVLVAPVRLAAFGRQLDDGLRASLHEDLRLAYAVVLGQVGEEKAASAVWPLAVGAGAVVGISMAYGRRAEVLSV